MFNQCTFCGITVPWGHELCAKCILVIVALTTYMLPKNKNEGLYKFRLWWKCRYTQSQATQLVYITHRSLAEAYEHAKTIRPRYSCEYLTAVECVPWEPTQPDTCETSCDGTGQQDATKGV